ncbi:MAG: hypothetical protein ACXAEF_09305 [Candidatus Thorarchaeota archaeon]
MIRVFVVLFVLLSLYPLQNRRLKITLQTLLSKEVKQRPSYIQRYYRTDVPIMNPRLSPHQETIMRQERPPRHCRDCSYCRKTCIHNGTQWVFCKSDLRADRSTLGWDWIQANNDLPCWLQY